MNILIISPSIIPSVILCGLKQCEYLHAQNKLEYVYKTADKVMLSDLMKCDIVLMIRGDYPSDEFVVNVCNKMHIPVIYVLDDDLLNVPNDVASGLRWCTKTTKRRLQRILKKSDFFASPSIRLIKKYGTRSLSFKIIEPSTFIINAKSTHKDNRIHIGFAGSVDRSSDIDAILSGVLKKVKSVYGDKISIEIFGAMPKLAHEMQVTSYSYIKSYEEYQKKMAELNWDIGLAPMPDTKFHACKHYNKLIEYAGFGIAGVYSNVEPYKPVYDMQNRHYNGVQNGVDGILCDNTEESWFTALSSLIEDSEMRNKIQTNCLSEAQSIYSVGVSANAFFGDVNSCLKRYYEKGSNIKKKVFCSNYLLFHLLYRALDYKEKAITYCILMFRIMIKRMVVMF